MQWKQEKKGITMFSNIIPLIRPFLFFYQHGNKKDVWIETFFYQMGHQRFAFVIRMSF